MNRREAIANTLLATFDKEITDGQAAEIINKSKAVYPQVCSHPVDKPVDEPVDEIKA